MSASQTPHRSAARRRRGVDRFGFEAAAAERWLGYVQSTLWPYFRPQVIGAENIPAGRGLIVGCHSGVIPYDAACALVAIHSASGRFARAIGDRFFARFGMESFLRQSGAVIGEPRVVEELLRANHLVLLFPGGAKDMERPYLTDRYRVLAHRGFAAGRGGYIKTALRTRTPIVPMAVVGAEEAHVLLATLPTVARVIGVPLFPLLLFPLPLPVKLYIRFGKPIRLQGGAKAAADQRRVDHLNQAVRRRLQHLIDDTVARRRGVILGGYRSNGRGAT
jgi:1-acyl-sn-glycerol-3-phosphate acyltransferase